MRWLSPVTCGFLTCIGACTSGAVEDPFVSGAAASGGAAEAMAGSVALGGSGAVTAGGSAGGMPSASGGAASQASTTGGGGAAPVAGSTGASPSSCTNPPSSRASWVCINGAKLMLAKRQSDGSLSAQAPFTMKGINWAPTGIGETNSSGYTKYYSEHAAQDVPLIANLAANTVKTYNAFELNQTGLALLDQLYASGIMVVMTVMPSYYDAQNQAYLGPVNFFKGHPAILMWVIGNEMNNNKLYNNAISLDTAVGLAAKAVDDIHAADPDHPVAVSWSNSPFDSGQSYYVELARADAWSLNLYSWLDLSGRFSAWQAHTQKPMFVGEYGADAWNGKLSPPGEDQASQANAVQTLANQILAYSSATTTHSVIGGCPFELTDEWWKGGNASTQQPGGFANGGVYPDQFANEAYWGLATVQRQPRQAYQALQAIYKRP